MTYLQCAAVPSFTRNVPPPMQFTSEARVNRAKKNKKNLWQALLKKARLCLPFPFSSSIHRSPYYRFFKWNGIYEWRIECKALCDWKRQLLLFDHPSSIHTEGHIFLLTWAFKMPYLNVYRIYFCMHLNTAL